MAKKPGEKPDRAKSVPIPEYIFDVIPGLKDGEKLALIAIARLIYASGQNELKISLSQISKGSGMTEKGAWESSAALEMRGIINRKSLGKDRRSGLLYSINKTACLREIEAEEEECDRAA